MYDNGIAIDGSSVTSLTTGAFTISSSANRAYLLGCYFTDGADTTHSAISCGGVTGVSELDTTFQYSAYRTRVWSGVAPASGSQTATVTFSTTLDFVSISAITATGIDQATPTSGAGFNEGASPVSQSVTSSSGDLTCSYCSDERFDGGQTTNRTKRTTGYGCWDTGPGTGTTIHTWTHAAGYEWVVGINLKAATASGSIPHKLMTLGVGF